LHKSESEPHGPGHALERLIFFSDAVFAIAITLLVIDIRVPDIGFHTLSDGDFLAALVPVIPRFGSFLLSFFVIGAFWAGHHRAFDCARHWSPKLVMPNLHMLCAVAAMPFFTALSSQHWGERVPTALYCGWMLVIGLLNIRLQRIVTAPPVVNEHVAPEHRAMIRRRGLAVALGGGTATLVALIAPQFGQIALASMAVWRGVLQRLNLPRI
jgi:uncharacterized membrane protein